MISKWQRAVLILICGVLAAPMTASAQDLALFEKKVTEFELDNGMKFIVVEKHDAPVVSMFTHADVGSVDEVKGITGMAHVFEHMAFKGTNTVGTKDLKKELDAMRKVDMAFDKLRAERNKGRLADAAALKELESAFEAAKNEAREFVVNNEFDRAINNEGAVGLNASTSLDWTIYYYNLPANKIELWFSLESDRFLNPVLREFYVEKDVVMEERRLRTESNPVGRLVEELLTTAYKAHPYGEPTVGHMSDLQSMTREEGIEFFKKYYGANNLTVVLVGDVDPKKMQKLAKTYFGRLPSKPKPDPVETIEPDQIGERRVVIEEKTQPFYLAGYHVGNLHHEDDAVYSVLVDIIGRGRSSRLNKRLVKDEKAAVQAGALKGVLGEKYPALMIFLAVPSQGKTAVDCEALIDEEISRLQNELVSAEELARAKRRERADLVRQLGSNSGLARQLAYYEVIGGDWRELFNRLDRISAVTAEDVQRVAKEILVRKNRTVALIQTESAAPAGTN